MTYNDPRGQDPFDPFGQEPVTPPHEDPQQGQEPSSEEHNEQETPPHTPLYGPDFFTGPRAGGGGYNPYGGGSFYGGASGGGQSSQQGGNSTQGGNGSFFGDSYFREGNPTPPPSHQVPKKNNQASVGFGLGVGALIITILCCGIGCFVGLPLGVVGLILSILSRNKGSSSLSVAGIIVSALAILFSLLMVCLILFGLMGPNFDYGSSGDNVNELVFFLTQRF